MSSAIDHWLNQAHYDLETARAMFKTGRYLYVLFCCQQAVEKAIKSIIVKRTSDFPPRLHNLLRLAEVAGIELEPEQEDFVGELSAYYIQTRYPEEIESAASRLDREIAQDTLHKTEEVTAWLFSMLK